MPPSSSQSWQRPSQSLSPFQQHPPGGLWLSSLVFQSGLTPSPLVLSCIFTFQLAQIIFVHGLLPSGISDLFFSKTTPIYFSERSLIA